MKTVNTVLSSFFDLVGVRNWPAVGHKVEKKKRGHAPPVSTGEQYAEGPS